MGSGGSAADGEVEEAFDPKGTLAIVAVYLLVFALVWLAAYAYLVLGPTRVGG